MPSPVIPSTTIPLETLSLQNYSLPLSSQFQPSSTLTTDTPKTDSLLNYIDFDRKIETTQSSLTTTPSTSTVVEKKDTAKSTPSNKKSILSTNPTQDDKKSQDASVFVQKKNEPVKVGSKEDHTIIKSEFTKDLSHQKEAIVVNQQTNNAKEINPHSTTILKENLVQVSKQVPVPTQTVKSKEYHPHVNMEIEPKILTRIKQESVKCMDLDDDKILKKNNGTTKNTSTSKIHPSIALNQNGTSKVNVIPTLPNLTTTNTITSASSASSTSSISSTITSSTSITSTTSTVNITPAIAMTTSASTLTNNNLSTSTSSSSSTSTTTNTTTNTTTTTTTTCNSTPKTSSVKSKSLPLSTISLFTSALSTPPSTQTSTPKSILPTTATATATTTTTSSITLESLSNLNMDFNDIPKSAELSNIMPILKSNVAKSCLNLLKETKGKPGRKKKSTTTNNTNTTNVTNSTNTTTTSKTTTTTTTATSPLTNVTIKTEPQSSSITDKVNLSSSSSSKKTSSPMVDIKPVVTKSFSTPVHSQASKDLKSNPSLQKYPVLKPKSQPTNMSTPFVLSILNQIHGKTPLFPLNNGLDMKKVTPLPSLLDSTNKKTSSTLSSLDKSKEEKKESIKYTNLNFKNQDFPTTPLCQSPFTTLTNSPSTTAINKNLPFPLSQSLLQQMNQKLSVLSTDQPNTTASKSDKKSAYQKRQDRLLKNREAAHLSRKRKREQLHKLEAHAQELISENQQLKEKVIELEKSNISYQDEIKDLKEKYEILKNVLMSSSAFKNANLSQLTLTPTSTHSTPPPSKTSTPNQKTGESTETLTSSSSSSNDSSDCTSPHKRQKTNNILFMIK
ncbi:hypothetical protein PIROE2DRAFT_9159 [Piromyces sp. E2]|nr:hypothetical protein PIROE2DRAFT_9159 [Piromyces sp. E2]|eukprot:OUM64125.1 hypothetical protein PIROE2DRAFT_9159 [Piromyces sp. E2]